MHNLRKFYYQNKEKMWKVILIVALVLGLIYLLSSFAIELNNSKIVSTTTNNTYYYNENNDTYISGTSAVYGESITKTEADKINNTISQFIEYCKNQKFTEAYNMLTEDCKQDRYNTLEKFTEQYAKVKFNLEQTYEIKKWESNTYQVEISEDILATGNVNNNQKGIEYITIDNQNNLNINGFIGKRSINKEKTENDVRIKLVDKQVYMDYEIYNFEIENLSNKTIKLDSLENTGTIYLTNRSENKFKAYMHEILDEEITIGAKHTFNISIKFANTYTANRNITGITFENLILDYSEYQKSTNKEEFEGICEFKIDL